MRFKILTDALLLAWLKSAPDLKRQPLLFVLIVFYSSLPLFFFLLFGAGLKGGIVGALVGSVAVIGLSTAIQELGWERYIKFREILVASPVSPLAYALGTAFAPLVLSMPGLFFFMGIALWTGTITLYSLPITLAVLVLCWASMASLGFTLSTYMHRSSTQTQSNLANLLGFSFVVLPPVYYSETLLKEYNWMAVLIPTSNVASLIRAYSGLLELSDFDLALRWIVIIGFVLVSIIVAGRKSRWREL